MWFSTDIGGSFTDSVIEEDDGRTFMFKAPTVPAGPVTRILAAFDVTAQHFGIGRLAHDVTEGWISAQRAREMYCVV